MNKALGQVITTLVTEITDNHVYVQKNGYTYQVVSNIDTELGETITGFAYLDQNDRLMLTTDIPAVADNQYEWAEIVDVRRDLGVFVDVGLYNKDIVVSSDHLPDEKHLWPKVGDKVLVSLIVDNHGRLWGKLATQELFKEKAHQGTSTQHNNNVRGHVFELRKSGSYVFTNDFYMAYIPAEERDTEPRIGELVEGRVIGLREDGVLYISLHPRAHEILDDDAKMIYEVIKRNEDNRIPYHDKSDPDEIRAFFGISKGAFKRAVGRLMKQNLVGQDKNGTYSISED